MPQAVKRTHGACGAALAAVAATTGAFAQSTVTVSGRLDVSAVRSEKVTPSVAANAVSVTTKSNGSGIAGQENGWTTSELRFLGTEDLGGGLKASFTINTGLSNVLGARDTNLALSGGFGTVRVGRFIPAAALGYNGYTGAASTNQAGTLYGIAHASTAAQSVNPNNFGNAATASTAGSFERNSNQIEYTSPSFNGVVVTANYGVSKSDISNVDGKAEYKQSGIGANYTAGALRIGAGMQKRDRQGDLANSYGHLSTANLNAALEVQGVTAAAEATTARKADLSWIGGSYNFGVATVFASHIKRDDKTAAGATQHDVKVSALGVSVPMGAITLNASMYNGKNKGTTAANDDFKLSGHQLSVTYALSKRTSVYAVMGEAKAKADGTNTAKTHKFTSNAIGLLHNF